MARQRPPSLSRLLFIAVLSLTEYAQAAGLSIEEVLVTAQKKEEGANSIPLAIATYTGDDLRALGVSDTRDLGRLLPLLITGNGRLNSST